MLNSGLHRQAHACACTPHVHSHITYSEKTVGTANSVSASHMALHGGENLMKKNTETKHTAQTSQSDNRKILLGTQLLIFTSIA